MSNEYENQSGFIADIRKYFSGVMAECRKITWPQKQQVIAETIIVLIIVGFITAVVYLIDIGFKGLFKFMNLI